MTFYHALVVRIALFFFFQAADGIRALYVTGVQTCALPILADAPPGHRVRLGDGVDDDQVRPELGYERADVGHRPRGEALVDVVGDHDELPLERHPTERTQLLGRIRRARRVARA